MGAFTSVFFTRKDSRAKLIEYCLDNRLEAYFFKLKTNSRYCEFIFEEVGDEAKAMSKDLVGQKILVNSLTMSDGEVVNFTCYYNGEVKYFLSNNYGSSYNASWQSKQMLELEAFKKSFSLSHEHILEGMKKPGEEALFYIAKNIHLQYFQTDPLLENIDQYKGFYSHLKG